MEKGKFSQLFTILCYAVSLGLQLVFSTVLGASAQQTGAPSIYLSFLLPQLGYLISFAVFSAIARIPAKVIFRLEDVKPLHYVYGLLAGLGLFFLALLPNTWVQELIVKSGSSSTVTLPPLGTAGEVTLAVLLICVLPAIGEELIFRKTFCEGMKGNNEWVIVLLGGLFFSLTHFNLAQTVHQFVLGCVLCFLYLRTGNVTVTVMIHFLNNALALFIEGWTAGLIDWTNMAVLGVSFAVGVVLLAASVFFVFKKTKKAEGGTAKVEPYTIGMLTVVGLLWLVTTVVSFFG